MFGSFPTHWEGPLHESQISVQWRNIWSPPRPTARSSKADGPPCVVESCPKRPIRYAPRPYLTVAPSHGTAWRGEGGVDRAAPSSAAGASRHSVNAAGGGIRFGATTLARRPQGSRRRVGPDRGPARAARRPRARPAAPSSRAVVGATPSGPVRAHLPPPRYRRPERPRPQSGARGNQAGPPPRGHSRISSVIEVLRPDGSSLSPCGPVCVSPLTWLCGSSAKRESPGSA